MIRLRTEGSMDGGCGAGEDVFLSTTAQRIDTIALTAMEIDLDDTHKNICIIKMAD